MSTTAEPAGIAEHPGESHDHEHHEPFRAHHFDSWKQQFDAGKLGMWAFLVQEILFFSGLFCAYTVYRTLHPEVFEFADQYLSVAHGAANTIVLLFSSLTMAWAVRCSMLGQKTGLIICLVVTLFCAALFLGVKAYEYTEKIQAHLVWAGAADRTVDVSPGGLSTRPTTIVQLSTKDVPTSTEDLEQQFIGTLHTMEFGVGVVALLALLVAGGIYFVAPARIGLATVFGSISLCGIAMVLGAMLSIGIHHQMHGGGDHGGHGEAAHASEHPAGETIHDPDAAGAPPLAGEGSPARLGTFFGIYYMMTGLHAVHIFAGIIALTWLLVRAVKGHFTPTYFGPVDFVGLYWHLVDLVWIYLFPLLYLIG